MITSVKLVDGSEEFAFQDPSWGNYDDVVWTKLSVASPEIRANVKSRTSGDGTVDRTRFHGSRAVSLEVRLASAPAAKVDELSTLLHPERRPYLVVTDTDWSPVESRKMLLRSSQWSNDITNTGSWFRDPSLSWVAPLGVWESFNTITYRAEAASTQLGRKYPLQYNRTYPGTSGKGLVNFVNPGNARSDFVARLYGPCSGPRLTNDMTGEAIVFRESLTLASGEYVELNSADITALFNSNASLSRMNYVDYASSTWWKVNPGRNAIRYNPVSGVNVGCIAEFDFRPSWL